MPLVDLTITPASGSTPWNIRRFLRTADARITRFQDAARIPAFVPSNYQLAFQLLQALSESHHIRGRQFCEWGSGFGVVASLASMLEFDSCGIEVEQLLVTEAERLAEDFGLSVEFVHGSFIPPKAQASVETRGTYSWLSTDGGEAYEDLGLDPDDMDVIFAYPWPDEEELTLKLFERYAGVGAILVTFHGGDDFRVQRKIGKRKR